MNVDEDFSSVEGEIREELYDPMQHSNTTCRQDEANGMFEGLAMTFGVAIFVTNLIVVIVIKNGGKKLRKARFYCIGNLAVADMLAGLLLLWIFGLQRVLLSSRPPYVELVQKCIWTLTIWTSLMSQVVIALDRYTHVRMGTGRSPTFLGFNIWENRQRRRLVQIGIAMTWIIPTVIYVIPVLTVWNCAGNCSCYTRENITNVIYMECAPSDYCSEVNPAFTKSSMLMLGLVLLVLPVVSFVFYTRIYLFVRNSSKRQIRPRQPKPKNHIPAYLDTQTRAEADDASHNYSKDDSYGGRSTPFLTPAPSDSTINQTTTDARNGFADGKPSRSTNRHSKSFDIKRSQDDQPSSLQRAIVRKSAKSALSKNQGLRQKNQARDMRLLHTMIIILTLFVVTTVPLGIVLTLSYTETDKRYLSATKYLLTCSLLNSLINPWVYFWRFSEMRIAISRLLCCGGTRNDRNRYQKYGNACLCCFPKSNKLQILQQNSKKHTSSNSSNTF